MKYYAGLDVSMKETFICIEDENGKVLAQSKTKTDPELIAEYFKKFDVILDKVGLESGALSHWLVTELNNLHIPTICIDARKMATILSVQVNKTDKNDAKGIATAMRCGLYRQVSTKTQIALEISTLLASRRLLVNQRVQISNSIRGLLKVYGLRLGPCGEVNFANKVRSLISENYALARLSIEELLGVFEDLCKRIRVLTKKVEALAREDADTKRLMTIPGIGAITALTFLVGLGNPKRFRKSRAVGAYFGMTPTQYSSGETTKQGRISKCGSNEVRILLNEAALVLMTRSRKWSRLKAWGLKIQRKHGCKKACMAVGRKLAVVMHRMLIDKTEFVYGSENEKKVA